MHGKPIIELHQVVKTYHQELGPDAAVHALRGVSLTLCRGEYVALMGSSGSGKSTLLNLLGCLDRPTSGNYRLDGHDVATLDDDSLSALRNRCLGFVFQSYNLIAQLSVLENIEVPLFYGGMHPAESRRRALELAGRVNLADRVSHRPSELSGGQQQRVAIARALANRPVMILADEPTGNLDSHTEGEVLDLFDELNAEGVTIAMVTHDDHVAARAHRIIRLRDGQVYKEEHRVRSIAAP